MNTFIQQDLAFKKWHLCYKNYNYRIINIYKESWDTEDWKEDQKKSDVIKKTFFF